MGTQASGSRPLKSFPKGASARGRRDEKRKKRTKKKKKERSRAKKEEKTNDSLGELVGSELLCSLASSLSQASRTAAWEVERSKQMSGRPLGRTR